MMSTKRLVVAGLFSMAVCASNVGLTQDKYNPLKPADTSSPRATLNSFIDSCNELYEGILAVKHVNRSEYRFGPIVDHILDCLDQSEMPEYARKDLAAEAAVELKEVLDRVPLPTDDEIPGPETNQQTNGDDKLQQWRIPETRIKIGLVKEGPRQGEYLFTPGTVERSAEFYETARRMPYRSSGREVTPGFREWYLSEPGSPAIAAFVRMLPDGFKKRAWGLSAWQWIGLTLASVAACGAMLMTYRFGRSRAAEMWDTSVVQYCISLIFLVLAMIVPIAFKYFTSDVLTLRGTALYATSFISNAVLLLTLLVVIGGATSRIAEVFISHPHIQPRGLDAQLIRIVCRLVGIVAGVLVFLEGGRYLGIPLTTLLASAGVGGLAVALAAQDMLRSLFGSIMILLDKPYRAGERIIVDKYDGIVEEIGLRSTKLRLLTGHMAMIPNEEMAKSRIENVGRRQHIRRITDIHIPLDTPRENVEKAIDTVRTTLDNHEGMQPDFLPRVYFNEFNDDSFNNRLSGDFTT